MFDVGTNSDECAKLRSCGSGTLPNGTMSDTARIWSTFSELSLTENFPFDDHLPFACRDDTIAYRATRVCL